MYKCLFTLQYQGAWYYVYNPMFLEDGWSEFLSYRFRNRR